MEAPKRSQVKEKESELIPPNIPENWDRCHAFMERKRRFCRQRPQPPSVYCGNHQHLDSEVGTRTGRKRIPCPIDSSHWIFEDMTDKHVLICPRVKKRKLQEEQPYFTENINAGGHGDLCSDRASTSDSGSVAWAQRLAVRVLDVHKRIFGDNADTIPAATLSWQDLHSMLPMQDFSQPEIDAGIEEAFLTNRIKSGGARHIPQLASLVGNLRSLKVLPSHGTTNSAGKSPGKKSITFLELGAGRGMFGLAAAGVAAANGIPTKLLMVERTGSRSKADKIFRTLNSDKPDNENQEQYFQLDSVKWSRIECDLLHVSLSQVLETEIKDDVDGSQVVVIAKHLCGAGTDLALKSMEPIKTKVTSCLLATCCHGICDWKLYVGRGYLCQVMETKSSPFGADEFDLLRRWCAGSVACSKIEKKKDKVPSSQKKHNNSSPRLDKTGNQEEDIAEHITTSEGADSSLADTTMPSTTALDSRISISAVTQSMNLGCGVQGLGRACQRLIDYGRLEYLRKYVFHGSSTSFHLCHYISPEVSPQNACLLGTTL